MIFKVMENPQLAQLTQFFKLQSKAFSIFFLFAEKLNWC